MKVIDNPELSRLMLDHLTGLYNLKKQRDEVHLSTLIYCLTRSFLDMKQDVEPTDMEVMLFALGIGLQNEFTPANTTLPVIRKDGVVFSPDFVIKVGEGQYCEMKTTRMSTARDFPESWIEYIKGGCFMQGIKEYDLSVLYMMGNYKPPFPQLNSFRLEFDEAELEANWKYLMCRKEVFDEALKNNRPPRPKEHCSDWECKNCRFKAQCDAMLMIPEPGIQIGGQQ